MIARWFLFRKGAQAEGQYTAQEISELSNYPSDLWVWKEGMSDWRNPEEVPEFVLETAPLLPAAARERRSGQASRFGRRTLAIAAIVCLALGAVVFGNFDSGDKREISVRKTEPFQLFDSGKKAIQTFSGREFTFAEPDYKPDEVNGFKKIDIREVRIKARSDELEVLVMATEPYEEFARKNLHGSGLLILYVDVDDDAMTGETVVVRGRRGFERMVSVVFGVESREMKKVWGIFDESRRLPNVEAIERFIGGYYISLLEPGNVSREISGRKIHDVIDSVLIKDDSLFFKIPYEDLGISDGSIPRVSVFSQEQMPPVGLGDILISREGGDLTTEN